MSNKIVINPDKLKEVIRTAKLEVLDTYEDDHELCTVIGVVLKGEKKQYAIPALFIAPEFFAKLVYMCRGEQYEEERNDFADYISYIIVEMMNDCYAYSDDEISDENTQVFEFLKKFSK